MTDTDRTNVHTEHPCRAMLCLSTQLYVLVDPARDAKYPGYAAVGEYSTVRADGSQLIHYGSEVFGAVRFESIAEAEVFAARLGLDNVEPRPCGTAHRAVTAADEAMRELTALAHA